MTLRSLKTAIKPAPAPTLKIKVQEPSKVLYGMCEVKAHDVGTGKAVGILFESGM